MINTVKGVSIRLITIFVNAFTLNRFFLVFYLSNTEDGQIVGQSSISTNGGFISRRKCIDEIIEVNALTKMTQKNTVITNVIEIKKSDTFTWLS